MKELNIGTELAQYTDNEMSLEVMKGAQFSEAYDGLVSAIEQLDGIKKSIDEKIKAAMEAEYLKTGNTKVECQGFSLSYVPGYAKESFDSKGFQKDHPKLAKQYVKTSLVSASLRRTVKKQKSIKEE